MAQARMAAMAHGVGAKSRLKAVEIAFVAPCICLSGGDLPSKQLS